MKKLNTDEKKKVTEDMLKEQEKNMKGKNIDKELQEALRVAQEAERAEEEEFMRKALEESK